MSEQPDHPAWAQPDWFARVQPWIQDTLASQHIQINGPITQPHLRPWSTVLQIPTASGAYYFKATAPLLSHEPPLTSWLTRQYPADTLPVLASNAEQGWLLLPDGGLRLREVIRADRDVRHWEALLPRYAELQIGLAEQVPELLAFGIPDRRITHLPQLYQLLLADTAALCIDQQDGLTSAQAQQLHQLVHEVAALCAQLAEYRIPDSLHHGDLHDGNIFTLNGQYRLFDWGDSSLSHPFFSLRTVFVSLEFSLDLPTNAPEFERLRDAYLEPWTRFETVERLRTAMQLSEPLSSICSALGWHHIVASLEEPLKRSYSAPVPSLLDEFLLTMSNRVA